MGRRFRHSQSGNREKCWIYHRRICLLIWCAKTTTNRSRSELHVHSVSGDVLLVKKTSTTLLRLQSDRMVEQYNRTLEGVLSKDLDEYLQVFRLWDHWMFSQLADVQTRHQTAFLFALFWSRRADMWNNHRYVSKICKKMDQTHHFARQQMKVKSGREKWNYDNRVETCIYNPGDSVWIHNSKWRKAIFPKLQHTWGGPYLVVKRLSDEVYQIQKLKGFKPKVVHFSCA